MWTRFLAMTLKYGWSIKLVSSSILHPIPEPTAIPSSGTRLPTMIRVPVSRTRSLLEAQGVYQIMNKHQEVRGAYRITTRHQGVREVIKATVRTPRPTKATVKHQVLRIIRESAAVSAMWTKPRQRDVPLYPGNRSEPRVTLQLHRSRPLHRFHQIIQVRPRRSHLHLYPNTGTCPLSKQPTRTSVLLHKKALLRRILDTTMLSRSHDTTIVPRSSSIKIRRRYLKVSTMAVELGIKATICKQKHHHYSREPSQHRRALPQDLPHKTSSNVLTPTPKTPKS